MKTRQRMLIGWDVFFPLCLILLLSGCGAAKYGFAKLSHLSHDTQVLPVSEGSGSGDRGNPGDGGNDNGDDDGNDDGDDHGNGDDDGNDDGDDHGNGDHDKDCKDHDKGHHHKDCKNKHKHKHKKQCPHGDLPAQDTVCNPFNQDQETFSGNFGLKGKIFFKPALVQDPPHPTENLSFLKLKHYFRYGIQAPVDLFLSRLYIPTQDFRAGFPLWDKQGELLKNDADEVLNEYFALKLRTQLVLRPQDEEGDYFLALLSDDGSKLIVEKDLPEEKNVLIRDDHEHSTKMECAKHLIHLEHGKPVPVKITYFQGKRGLMALTLMWVRVGNNVCGKKVKAVDQFCKAEGDALFFDPDHGSVPRSAFLELLELGWKVPATENFLLPDNRANPCIQM